MKIEEQEHISNSKKGSKSFDKEHEAQLFDKFVRSKQF